MPTVLSGAGMALWLACKTRPWTVNTPSRAPPGTRLAGVSRAALALVIGAGGLRRLADDHVEGEDPLAAFGSTAADHLRRHDSFTHCPDLLVNDGAGQPTSIDTATACGLNSSQMAGLTLTRRVANFAQPW
jgi:hypothetical protein